MYPVAPYSFAVQASPGRDIAEWAQLIGRTEDLGYDALLLPDHVGSGGALMTGMASAAAFTRSLRIGSLMAAVDFRNPVVLAHELMTLDGLLDGKLEVGVGAGWLTRDFLRAGLPAESATARIERLRECVEIVTELWSGRSVSYRGRHFTTTDSQITATPSSPAPRWTLGGGGQHMVRLAASVADVVSLSASMAAGRKDAPLGDTASAASFKRRLTWVEEEASKRGFFPVIQCLAFETAVVDDPEEHVRSQLSGMFSLSTQEILESPLTLVGDTDTLCKTIDHRRATLGISYWVVKASVMEQFAPVVQRLSPRRATSTPSATELSLD